MSDVPRNSDNYCYRHPDRQSFVLCQRCGRTICIECQTPAAVGVQCPECIREARGNMPRVRPQSVTRVQTLVRSGGPIVTYAIMALSVLGYLLHLVPGTTNALFYGAPYVLQEPWRIVTGLFLHTSILQILFNLYSIWLFGRMLESQIGRVRFAALYLLSGLGGEVALSVFAPGSGIAGGTAAIFGMFAAFFVIQRHAGNQAVQLLVILGLNIVIGLVVGAPWQSYLGGIAIGALTAWIFTKTGGIRDLNRQRLFVIGLAVVLVIIALVRAASLSSSVF
jgi:membrane associated rhomboid family serine protease